MAPYVVARYARIIVWSVISSLGKVAKMAFDYTETCDPNVLEVDECIRDFCSMMHAVYPCMALHPLYPGYKPRHNARWPTPAGYYPKARPSKLPANPSEIPPPPPKFPPPPRVEAMLGYLATGGDKSGAAGSVLHSVPPVQNKGWHCTRCFM